MKTETGSGSSGRVHSEQDFREGCASSDAAPCAGGSALHAAIMNLPCNPPLPHSVGLMARQWYAQGHKDARHAAAELVAATTDTGWQAKCCYPCCGCSVNLHTGKGCTGAPGSTDAERAAWLADKIVAGGDYAKEAAAMLRRWPTLGDGSGQ